MTWETPSDFLGIFTNESWDDANDYCRLMCSALNKINNKMIAKEKRQITIEEIIYLIPYIYREYKKVKKDAKKRFGRKGMYNMR